MAQEEPACAVVDKTMIALPRILSLWDVVMIVIGGVVGSGFFLTPSNMAISATRSTCTA